MVSRRGLSRAPFAVLLTVALASTGIVFLPQAEAAHTPRNLKITEFWFSTTNGGSATPFITAGQTIYAHVKVECENEFNANLPCSTLGVPNPQLQIPVLIYEVGFANANANPTLHTAECVRLTLNSDNFVGTSNYLISIPTALASSGTFTTNYHHFRAIANFNKNAAPGWTGAVLTNDEKENCYSQSPDFNEAAADEPPAGGADDFTRSYFATNNRFDLSIAAADFKWCPKQNSTVSLSETALCPKQVDQVTNEGDEHNINDYLTFPLNRTHYERRGGVPEADRPALEGPTHFELRVRNAPTATFQPTDLDNPNCVAAQRTHSPANCENIGINFGVRVLVKDMEATGTPTVLRANAFQVYNDPDVGDPDFVPINTTNLAAQSPVIRVGDFYLEYNASRYQFTAEVDFDNKIPELVELSAEDTNNRVTSVGHNTAGGGGANITAPDLQVFVDTADSRYRSVWLYNDPDPLDANHVQITVPFKVNNSGRFKAQNESHISEGAWQDCTTQRYRTWVSILARSIDTDHMSSSKAVGCVIEQGLSETHVVTFFATKGNDNGQQVIGQPTGVKWVSVPEGTHTFYLYVDPPKNATSYSNNPPTPESGCSAGDAAWSSCRVRGNVIEKNERNNAHAFSLTLASATGPAFSNFKINNDTDAITLHPGEKFFAQAFFNDSFPLVNVTLNVTKADGAAVPGFKPLKMHPIRNSTSEKYFARSLKPSELVLPVGNYKMWVWVNDTSGGSAAYESAKKDVTIAQWSIHALPDNKIFKNPTNGTTLAFNGDAVVVRVLANESDTGWPATDQRARPNVDVLKPDGTRSNGNRPAPQKICLNRVTNEERTLPIAESCNPVTEETRIYFTLELLRTPPGTYKIRANITDAGGKLKGANLTYGIQNSLPQIVSLVKDVAVNAGASATIAVRASDDVGVSLVTANFTRSGFYCNATLPRTFGTEKNGWYNASIPTGKATGGPTMACTAPFVTLVHGGPYSVKVGVRDVSSTWANVSYNLQVVDRNAPSVSRFGVSRSPAPIDHPITFYAVATDETLMKSAVLQLTGPASFSRTLTMNGTQTNANGRLVSDVNFTRSFTFTNAGDYTWEIRVTDSMDNVTRKNGALQVTASAGPLLEVSEPKKVGSDVVGGPTPRIVINAIDRDNVNRSTMKLTLTRSGATAETLTCASPGVTCAETTDPKGATFTYQRPAAGAWSHGTTVTLAFEAFDLSTPAIKSDAFTATLKVDGRAPSSQAPTATPSTRARESDILNVSATSTLTLRGSDSTEAPASGLAAVHYKIKNAAGSVASQGRKTIDNLRVPLGNSYTSGEYKVEHWAEDAAGNMEIPHQNTTIFVDNDQPVPDTTNGVPSGRYVNVTFIDRSGIANVKLLWRLNEGAYQTIEMRLSDGLWRAVINAGSKGDFISYYILAEDKLGNVASWRDAASPLARFPVENNAPTLTIVSPDDGDTLEGRTRIEWQTADADGDRVTITVSLKPDGGDIRDVARVTDGSKSTTIDTARYPDGDYTLKLTATDGFFFTTKDVAVKIENGDGDPVEVLAPDASTPTIGEEVVVRARVALNAIKVEADVYVDGVVRDTLEMYDDGEAPDEEENDGIYTTSFYPDSGGDYGVVVRVTYREGGEEKTFETDVGAFSLNVRDTPRTLLGNNKALFIAIGILAVAGVAVAAVGLTRGGRGRP